ncbi:antibiotic biosynthesis monooxygenase family protein [Streptomyces sp. NPDC092369]|uniref:antibiotic biosynthesis monooxygenase family protein n=1 Tax=Streptomyces sp. NPDC092369 TaxID=3366015 RepID=UPI0037F6F7F3
MSDQEHLGEANYIYINGFEVPVGRDEQFFAAWKKIDDYMVVKPGYRWNRLHKSLDDKAALRYINVVGWDSVEEFEAAHDAGFHELRRSLQEGAFHSTPALYRVDRASDAEPDAN